MDVIRLAPHDPQFAALHALYLRTQQRPFDAPWALEELRANLSDDAYAQHVVLLALDDGDPVGCAWVELPLQDNRETVFVEVHVVPERRRRGVGSALLERCRAVAREHGRSRVYAETTWDVAETTGPGLAFAEHHGFGVDLLDAIREQPLPAPPVEAPLRDGYTAVAWRICPPQWLEQYAHLRHLILTEAPAGPSGIEGEYFDAARIRHEEERWASVGRTGQIVAAIAPDGRLAGHTQLVVSTGQETAYQWDTLVLREHRGHGLGLALKVRALSEAADLLAGVRRIVTWNAASNTHMIVVNERLGYRQIAWAAEVVGPA